MVYKNRIVWVHGINLKHIACPHCITLSKGKSARGECSLIVPDPQLLYPAIQYM
jgi:hypothetical protein